MCDFLSAVLAKERLFFGPTDRHAEIIDYHRLHESGAQGVNLVKLELLPDRADDPVDVWKFKVDQDLLPDWFDATKAEARIRKAARDSGVDKLYADWRAKCDQIDADWEAKCAPIDADYRVKRAPIDADWEAKRDQIDEDYEAKRDQIDEDYEAKRKVIADQIW